MTKLLAMRKAPDDAQRKIALDVRKSLLVEAPAGSGKTTLLTQRFLELLAEVEEPGQIVAITFTNAAAAEMRNRILGELEKAALSPESESEAEDGEGRAWKALRRSQERGWNLLDLPAQLRIQTIDSFCRELTLQQPLLSGLGGGLAIHEQPLLLYRRAARSTLETVRNPGTKLSDAIERLLLWRDNNWQELENLMVRMLGERDRWMQGFLLSNTEDRSEEERLRRRLEDPFEKAVRAAVNAADALLGTVPGALDEAMALARFACSNRTGLGCRRLAELAEFPRGPFDSVDDVEEALQAHLGLASLVLTGGEFRTTVNVAHGFPSTEKYEKARLQWVIEQFRSVAGLKEALAGARRLPPAAYSEEDWSVISACFAVLRRAAAELRLVFAEAGAVDFVEVAQTALGVLRDEDGLPNVAAMGFADGIHHLLVDEFQDTSRRQHELLAALIAAWPEREGRTCFLVGDPMQSIYLFRNAEAELFGRVKNSGLEIRNELPLSLETVALRANFRTETALLESVNRTFESVFAKDDGSGVAFTASVAARGRDEHKGFELELHLEFVPTRTHGGSASAGTQERREAAHRAQVKDIVDLIETHLGEVRNARAQGRRYRIAVLGRSRKALTPIAEELHKAGIPFRAVDLEDLAERPELLDALALAKALLSPLDRVAWLGVLRAPWCGLSLAGLHKLVSADGAELLEQPVRDVAERRSALLPLAERKAVERTIKTMKDALNLRSVLPDMRLGTWLEQVWLQLGGADCTDSASRANVELFWRCLDELPDSDVDLLGPAMEAALRGLKAQPDPEASTECGVQLMTIHKSKGLEFEMVIVPELQARTAVTRGKMLSWLERGLAEPDESGEISEFLVAPFQPKGAEPGKAKKWVEDEYHRREQQEMRRLLYVAATRAREELHLFARPSYKEEQGNPVITEPEESLLRTAWPALSGEIRARFDRWLAARQGEEDQVVPSLAASGQVLVMPEPVHALRLRRLPAEYRPEIGIAWAESLDSDGGAAAATTYDRHEGGLATRALGTAVHSMMEETARLRTANGWEETRFKLPELAPRLAAQMRAMGMDARQAKMLAQDALGYTIDVTNDGVGQWILSPRENAESEAAWVGVLAGELRSVRVDRVFRAGGECGSEGAGCWWVIDYKSALAAIDDPAKALPELRRTFAPQLELYAQMLRKLHGAESVVHAGLYYPRMLLFDWWTA